MPKMKTIHNDNLEELRTVVDGIYINNESETLENTSEENVKNFETAMEDKGYKSSLITETGFSPKFSKNLSVMEDDNLVSEDKNEAKRRNARNGMTEMFNTSDKRIGVYSTVIKDR